MNEWITRSLKLIIYKLKRRKCSILLQLKRQSKLKHWKRLKGQMRTKAVEVSRTRMAEGIWKFRLLLKSSWLSLCMWAVGVAELTFRRFRAESRWTVSQCEPWKQFKCLTVQETKAVKLLFKNSRGWKYRKLNCKHDSRSSWPALFQQQPFDVSTFSNYLSLQQLPLIGAEIAISVHDSTCLHTHEGLTGIKPFTHCSLTHWNLISVIPASVFTVTLLMPYQSCSNDCECKPDFLLCCLVTLKANNGWNTR